MQLTRAADYALRVMVHLAGLPPGTRVSRGVLAEAADCPEQFLSKVLQDLTRAGLMNSHRGNAGGFVLGPGRGQTSVLEIVEAIEGPVSLNVCVGTGSGCDRHDHCPTHQVWQDAQVALEDVLRRATVGDLASQMRGGLLPLAAPPNPNGNGS
jgi:Rrf2 family protein